MSAEEVTVKSAGHAVLGCKCPGLIIAGAWQWLMNAVYAESFRARLSRRPDAVKPHC